MRCSRCGAEMKIKNVKTGTDIYGNPIYNKYAYCYQCKIKRNLDQHAHTAGKNQRKLSAKRKKQRKKKKLLFITFFLLLLAVIAGVCIFLFQKRNADGTKKKDAIVTGTHKNEISSQAFSELETGMTQTEVEDIINHNGNRLMQAASGDSVTERYQWVGEHGNGAVILTFKDKKLIDISQSNMVVPDSVTLSADSAGKLKFDMTYEDVVNELGTEGMRMSETLTDGVTDSLYTWYDSNSGTRITVVFKDNKVVSVN